MATPTATEWVEANQRYLMARVGAVRAALEAHVAKAAQASAPGSAGSAGASPYDLDEAEAALPAPSALDRLCQTFSLSPFERDVLVLCAAVELDGSFPPLCAAAQGDARLTSPTFSLALAALAGAHWSALTAFAPLRRWRLVELGPGEALTTSPLHIEERVLHYLAGTPVFEHRLMGLVQPVPPAPALAPSHGTLAERLAELWSADPRSAPATVQLCGEDRGARRGVAVAAGQALGMGLFALAAAHIPSSPSEREALARLWHREAALSGSALLLELDEGDDRERMQVLLTFLEGLDAPVAVSSRDPVQPPNRPLVRLDVRQPGPDERLGMWRQALGPLGERLDGQLEQAVRQFELPAQGLRAVAAELLGRDQGDAGGDVDLWGACRAQARPRLDDLAHRLEPAAGWEDLVLPDPELEVLAEVATHVRQRRTVYEAWGFAARGTRGLGITALFSGASGTGKTMAAEVLARELDLDLYLIDLSSVVDKYIGETEKRLRRLFDAAEEGGSILLFDEADALFGKRSEVKDSHDRYANIEVSYLLQRMESYRGLAILTTNLKHVLDPAFLRRIRFHVHFAFPDAAHRERIWRRVFPEDTPTEGLRPEVLARLNIAGGNIRNIAMGAAFLAAGAGEPVQMAHLLRAARTEYSKLERPLSEAETGGWV